MTWRERQRLLFNTAVLHAVVLVICAVLALFDGTQILGVNRWVKPMKFSASIAIYLGTITWYWPMAEASALAKSRAARILAGTMVFEIAIILMQAARGVRSHFNLDTWFDATLFNLMGVAIIVNIVVALAVCRWTFRTGPSAYVWGVRLGLLVFALFALEGVIMALRLGHAVGVPDGGPGLPFLNWSTTGGDLRVAHFLGMHALQALPLVGYVSKSTGAVAAAAILWALVALTALWRALAGLPII
ncbi:MAG: hypothetical protein HYX27_12235 [Acidobacteria bacterium]|nr:hypothetical protein [Acidobacteriota bacterium]